VNNDGGANYDLTTIALANVTITGTNVQGATSWSLQAMGDTAYAGGASMYRMSFPGYAQTTFFKVGEASYVAPEDTAADTRMAARGLTWRNTAAITRLAITGSGGDLKAGSRLLIYGR
jgi:hypothetical protein